MENLGHGQPQEILPKHVIDAWVEMRGDIGALLVAAYEAGFSAGAKRGVENIRSALLNVMDAPLTIMAATQPAETQPTQASLSTPHIPPVVQSGGKGTRAPRGAVRQAIIAGLEVAAGMTEQELGAWAADWDKAVSARSVGAELRRHKGRLYRSEKGRWFLIDGNVDTETAEPQSPAVPQPQTTTEERNAPATIAT